MLMYERPVFIAARDESVERTLATVSFITAHLMIVSQIPPDSSTSAPPLLNHPTARSRAAVQAPPLSRARPVSRGKREPRDVTLKSRIARGRGSSSVDSVLRKAVVKVSA